MSELLSAESIIADLSGQIALKRVACKEGPDLPLHEIKTRERATLISTSNRAHNDLIQRVGGTECDHPQYERQTRTSRATDISRSIRPVAPGCNLEALIEAAVNNHALRTSGNDATEPFTDLQQQAINNKAF